MIDAASTTAIAGVAGSAIGGLFAWLAMREQKAPDVQASIATAVAGIVESYQEALKSAQTAQERLTQQVEHLSDEIEDMRAHIDTLTNALVKHGVPVPERKPRAKVRACAS